MDPTRSALRAANFILAALFSVGGPGRAMEARPNGVLGTTFPGDFPRIVDTSLGKPVILNTDCGGADCD